MTTPVNPPPPPQPRDATSAKYTPLPAHHYRRLRGSSSALRYATPPPHVVKYFTAVHDEGIISDPFITRHFLRQRFLLLDGGNITAAASALRLSLL